MRIGRRLETGRRSESYKYISHYISFVYFFQLIKQSQMILNLLAMENKITNEHIDCIWAASQVSILYIYICTGSRERNSH